MKHFTAVALVVALVGSSLAACSSSSGDDDDSSAAGKTSTGGSTGTAGTGVTLAGTSTGGSSNSGGTTGTAGTTTTAGTASGGTSAAGTGSGGTSAAGTSAGGTASGGSGGASGGSSGSGGSGGSNDNPNAVVTTCGVQTYTPTATPGAACVTKAVPAAALIAAFDTAVAAPGWGIYPNVDGKTGFMPTTPVPSAGGANSTAMALNFTVTNVEQGIKIQVGFGTQCQDVRTFKGLSFWAKGTIDAATVPFAVDANNIVIQVGSETSLLGGCQGGTCSAAPPDKRVAISADWKEYRIPFDCFGDGMVFDGYYTNILFSAFGTNAAFSIDQVGYY